MKRREFLKHCSVSAGALAALGSKAFSSGIEFANNSAKFRIGAKRYNVLFVLADQWRNCSLSFGKHHDKLVRTPNLEKFAKEGAHWTRCYAAQPVCTPNRSAIMTGRFPHETGMYNNDLLLPEAERCIAHGFTEAGYNSHYIGKWHMDGGGKGFPAGYVPPGWHRRGFTTFEGFNRGHNYWYYNSYMITDDGQDMKTLGLFPDNTYEPTFQTDLAINFMQQNKNHPFFCFVSWGPPHGPYGAHPAEYDYDPAQVELRPNVDGSSNKTSIADYYAHCTGMDVEFGRLMQALKENGLEENTLVVFSSDHGDLLYSHAADPDVPSTGKNRYEEESCHIPLLMRLPGRIKPGMIVDNLISSVDLMPTIHSICGLDAPSTCTGKDKSKALTSEGMADESIYAINLRAGYQPFWRMVVKGSYKLAIEIASIGATPTAAALYNLDNDPYELTNLVNDPAYAAVQSDLWAEYEMWKTKTNDPFPAMPPSA